MAYSEERGEQTPLRVQFNAVSAGKRKRFQDAPFLGVIEEEAEKYAKRVVADLQVYPPEPPDGSEYKRTGDLRRGWQQNGSWQSVYSHGAYAVVFNNRVRQRTGQHRFYANNVQGVDQLAMHARTGWLTLEDAMNREDWHRTIQKAFNKGAAAFNAANGGK